MLRFSILYGADRKQIKQLLEKVGLSNMGAKKAGEFSLGMRQRLGIAISLLSNPEILVLDEPINGLDPAGIKEIRDVILNLNREGVTFIISSHLLDELAKVVTEYGIIADGKLIDEFSSQQLERRCRKSVKISIDDNKKALELLKSKAEDISAEIKPDGLYLSNYIENTASINRYLISNGVSVSEIAINESVFEDYFIERLGK